MSVLAKTDGEGALPLDGSERRTVPAAGPSAPAAGPSGEVEGGAGSDESLQRAREARIALSLTTEPGDPEVGLSVQRWGAEQAWRRAKAASAKARELPAEAVAEQLRRGQAVGARCVIPGDPQWPSQLDDLGAGTPLLLWVRGAPVRSALLRSVGIVGARSCTRYGREQAETLASDLALRGWSVVSGGAFGIDAAAHLGAMAVGGVTVVVSAAGVDQVYPRAHDRLFGRVIERGAVVSEYPLGAAPLRHRFLARNRLIAALTRGTVIVEAAQRSGARGTAAAASELNRHVMAFPGPVTSDMSVGCHQLIRTAEAVLVCHAGEVIELLSPLSGESDEVTTGEADRTRELLKLLAAKGPLMDTVIAAALSGNPDEVTAQLSAMEGQGILQRHPRGWAVAPAVLERVAHIGW